MDLSLDRSPSAAALKFCIYCASLNDGLALALFMLWILTNDSDTAFSLDNLALFANRFYRRSYLHVNPPFFSLSAPWRGDYCLLLPFYYAIFYGSVKNCAQKYGL